MKYIMALCKKSIFLRSFFFIFFSLFIFPSGNYVRANSAVCSSTFVVEGSNKVPWTGALGENIYIQIGISKGSGDQVSERFVYDGYSWRAPSSFNSYATADTVVLRRSYTETKDFAVAAYWRFADGSDIFCTQDRRLGIFYREAKNYGSPTLTYYSSYYPNQASTNLTITGGSHTYIGYVLRSGANGTWYGYNSHTPIGGPSGNDKFWRMSDEFGEFKVAGFIQGNWSTFAYWMTTRGYPISLPTQVVWTMLSPKFNSGEGDGSWSTYDLTNVVVFSRDNQRSPVPTPKLPSTPIKKKFPNIFPTRTPPKRVPPSSPGLVR